MVLPVSLLHSGVRPLCTCTEWEAVDHRWTPKLGISQESAADRMGALSRLWMSTCFISASGIEFLCQLLLVAPLCFSNQPWWFKMAWCSQWAGFYEKHTFYFFPIVFSDIIVQLTMPSLDRRRVADSQRKAQRPDLQACDVVVLKLDTGKHHPTLPSAPGPT